MRFSWYNYCFYCLVPTVSIGDRDWWPPLDRKTQKGKRIFGVSPFLLIDHTLISEKSIDNRRFGTLQFRVDENYVVHGLAGYFEADLYKGIKLSIRPETHSPKMFSWFPLLFPLKVGISFISCPIENQDFSMSLSSVFYYQTMRFLL